MTFSPTQREELRKLDTETRLRLRAALTTIIADVRAGTLKGDIRTVGEILCGEWDQDFPMALFEGSLAAIDALDAAEGALLSASRDHAQTTCSALEWRPIETAPRDGTRIDLWMINNDGRSYREADAYWVDDRDVDPYGNRGKRSGWFGPNHDYEGMDGWADDPAHPDRLGNIRFTSPTHWGPLPAPPGSASTGVAAQVVGDKSRK